MIKFKGLLIEEGVAFLKKKSSGITKVQVSMMSEKQFEKTCVPSRWVATNFFDCQQDQFLLGIAESYVS